MKNKEKYDDFFKNLKTAVTNISVYFAGHPIVAKAVKGLKESVDDIFSFAPVLKIGITADSLMIGSDVLKDDKIYKDTADFFHSRKIKSLEIKRGVTESELESFLKQASAPSGEILSRGGLAFALKKEAISNIIVQDLDYSQLLKGEGEQYKDIWLALLSESFAEGDDRRTDELKKFSPKAIGGITIEELASDEGKREVIRKFFNYLKAKDKDKFSENSEKLAEKILSSRDIPNRDKVEKLKGLMENISSEGFSRALLGRLQEEELSNLNLDLFAQIISRKKHESVASSLTARLKGKDYAGRYPLMAGKIKELLTSNSNLQMSEVYERNLISAVKGVPGEGGGRSLDSKRLSENYNLILLDLFFLETDGEKLRIIIDNIFQVLAEVPSGKQKENVERLARLLIDKKSQRPGLSSLLEEAGRRLSGFIEKIALKEGVSFLRPEYMSMLQSGEPVFEDYAGMIFSRGDFNPNALKLFFYLFPKETKRFYERLDKASRDTVLIKRIVDGLGETDVYPSLEALKRVFYSANDFIKSEVLKSMANLSRCDEEFLLSVVKSGNFIQRKQALSLLVKKKKAKSRAAGALLGLKNPFGINNKLIKENLVIFREIPFPEGREIVKRLSGYRFFWNRGIRKKAREIIGCDV